MGNNKTKITKELVKEQYKRSFLNRYILDIIISVIMIGIFLPICIVIINAGTRSDGSYVHIVPLWYLIRMLAFPMLITIIGFLDFLLIAVEFITVMRGNFNIRTDTLKERKKSRVAIIIALALFFSYFWAIIARILWRKGVFAHFRFEAYGMYVLKKAYSPSKGRPISIAEQLDEAYIGDDYFVAVTRKSKKIIAVFNSKEYHYE